jgi:hypothetical protein
MDKYIGFKVHSENKLVCPIGRDQEARLIHEVVKRKETLCVYGLPGVGKTFVVRHVLEATREPYIYLDYSNFKNSFDTFSDSVSHVILDDFDLNVSKELHDYLIENNKLSSGSTIIITETINKLDFCTCLHIQPLSTMCMLKIANKSDHETKKFAEVSNGNIRNFIDYTLNGSSEKDEFYDSKAYINDILCCRSPIELIGKTMDNHGRIWGVVHDNYPDAQGITMETASTIAECMSLADITDEQIFKGDLESSMYFSMYAVVTPIMLIGQNMKQPLRPGSFWTKFNNFKMREKLHREMTLRTRTDIDTLMLVHNYMRIDEMENVMKLVRNYKMQSSDIDTLNHLAFYNKLKPKVISNYKKNGFRNN